LSSLSAGKSIRDIRKKQNLSLRKLAAKAEISPSYLSQIEGGKIDPSLSVLRRLSAALNVPLFTLVLDHEPRSLMLVRKDERRRVLFEKDGLEVEIIHLDFEKRFDFTIVSLHSGCASAQELGTHDGQECLFVLEGEVRVEMSGKAIQLEVGDSLFFESASPHRVINKGKKVCRFIHSHSPPGYPGYQLNRRKVFADSSNLISR
jgi:transcriptional regulator with XRE-family HTH domain